MPGAGCAVPRAELAAAHYPGWFAGASPASADLFNRHENAVHNEGWSPGEPLTDQLQVVSPAQLDEYRRTKAQTEPHKDE